MEGPLMFKLRTMADSKKGFFDREAVIRAVDKATLDRLSRFGAFVRQTAKKSMLSAPPPYGKVVRDRKSGAPVHLPNGQIKTRLIFRYSRPGDPPYARRGFIKRDITFDFDFQRRSVVIGPTLLPGWPNSTVLRLHEKGGTVAYKNKKGRQVTKKYPARPYMQPAFDKELALMPEPFRNSVRP
jgi:hypothetical protein